MAEQIFIKEGSEIEFYATLLNWNNILHYWFFGLRPLSRILETRSLGL
jgi:hypothetical protein